MAKVIANGGLFDNGGENGNGASKKSSAYVSFQPCPICLDCFVPVPEGLLRVPAGEWIKAIKDGAEVFDLIETDALRVVGTAPYERKGYQVDSG